MGNLELQKLKSKVFVPNILPNNLLLHSSWYIVANIQGYKPNLTRKKIAPGILTLAKPSIFLLSPFSYFQRRVVSVREDKTHLPHAWTPEASGDCEWYKPGETLQDSNEKSKDENTTQLFLQRLWQTRNHQIFYLSWKSDLKFEISAVVPTWKVDVRWYNMVLDLLVRCLKNCLKHILPNPNGDKHVGLPWSEVKIITKKTNLLGGWTTHLQNISGGENKKYLKPSKVEWDRIPTDPEM